MSDNTTLPGTGDVIADEDISGVKFQRVKVVLGAVGAADQDIDSGQQTGANSVPVVLPSDCEFVKAEDAVHSSGDKGIMGLAVRKDTAIALAGSDGDYAVTEVDAVGALWVHSLAEGVEDAAETAGANLMMMGAVRRDAAASSAGASGDNATMNVDAQGAQWVRMWDVGWSFAADYAGAQTNTQLVAAPGAGSLFVTDLVITNDGTAALTAKLLNGSAGTNLTGTLKISAPGGIVIHLRTPIKLSATTALCLTTTGTTNFTVLVSGYTAA